ncbi:MAG: 3-dehydroquinate synthase [Actinomycetota bacterium]|nr:3-dehydroquinate synthase [Actinomycetota bacterium]
MRTRSELRIRSSSGDYAVVIGRGSLEDALASADVVMVDANLADTVAAGAMPVLPVKATEDEKTLAGIEKLVVAMNRAGVRRGHRLLAVGGGVVQDVATFASAVYMRGLTWTFAPTTLMAMADSCIGGKSSINVGGLKNLVGNFHPPRQIVIATTFLTTLDASAISAGLAEAVKISFCRGSDAFHGYLSRWVNFAEDPEELLVHVLDTKRWFVEIDEHDEKERRQLNFGHTFGHALETAVRNRISHGAAVAVGMLCAIDHPLAAKTSDTQALGTHCRALLSQVTALPQALSDFDAAEFERAFRSDKKHTHDQFRLILPQDGGGVREIAIPVTDQAWTDILAGTRSVLFSLGGDAP